MPFVPYHLSDVLNSPTFSPYTATGVSVDPEDSMAFVVVLKSLLHQIFTALAFIHERGIAHRDIKPRNVLLTPDGLVKLIDFGVSWTVRPDDQDLWPEPPGRMCFDVATGYVSLRPGIEMTMNDSLQPIPCTRAALRAKGLRCPRDGPLEHRRRSRRILHAFALTEDQRGRGRLLRIQRRRERR